MMAASKWAGQAASHSLWFSTLSTGGARPYRRHVHTYLIETYLPRSRVAELEVRAADLRAAVLELRQAGARIRYVRSTFLPEDETCFHIVEGSSLRVVHAAIAHAKLAADRITEAVDEPQPTSDST
jgi:hypothetical protein